MNLIVVGECDILSHPVRGGKVMALAQEIRTTTVRLPRPIYDQAKCVVDREKKGGGATVTSLNDLIVAAIKAYLKMYKRRQIDAAFAAMAEDADYQKEASLLAEEFSYSDWEALRIGEETLEVGLNDVAGSSR
jgi:hypothetical protein